jgi:hypothetical protein
MPILYYTLWTLRLGSISKVQSVVSFRRSAFIHFSLPFSHSSSKLDVQCLINSPSGSGNSNAPPPGSGSSASSSNFSSSAAADQQMNEQMVWWWSKPVSKLVNQETTTWQSVLVIKWISRWKLLTENVQNKLLLLLLLLLRCQHLNNSWKFFIFFGTRTTPTTVTKLTVLPITIYS